MLKSILIAFSIFFVSFHVNAKNISIDPTTFMHSIHQAEQDPNFIDRYETGDGSLFIQFRAKELDHDGLKVVIEKAFNADQGAVIRYSFVQTDLSCINRTLQRTFYFFNVSGLLLTMKEQELTVLALNTKLGEVACSEN